MVPLHSETLVGDTYVPITAQQAVLDTGSSVITATDVDAFLINSVRWLRPCSLLGLLPYCRAFACTCRSRQAILFSKARKIMSCCIVCDSTQMGSP